MKRILFSLAATTVLMAAANSEASAFAYVSCYSQYGSYQGSYHNSNSYGHYGNTYRYESRHYNHWSHRRWDSRYGCQVYYHPTHSSWYYWCQPANCYYPVSYCPYQTYSWSGSSGPQGIGGPQGPGIGTVGVSTQPPANGGPIPGGGGVLRPSGGPTAGPMSLVPADDGPPVPQPVVPVQKK